MNYETDLQALIDRDRGLPGECFTGEAFFDIERRAIFQDNWMCIGLAADVSTHGEMFPVTVLTYPLLMVRDGTTVRVFHNVCSHRGAMLVTDGKRHGPRIVCPYHSWAYRLNGELAATPHVGGAGQHGAGEFHRSLNLRQVRSAEWAGHVFVNLSGSAPEFADWIKPAAERFQAVDWSELRHDPLLGVNCDVAANWKIICENFVESYHLPAVHRDLNRVNPMETHYQILGGHSYVGQGGTAYDGDCTGGSVLPVLQGMDLSKYESLSLFPNLIIAPLGNMAFSIILMPQSAERTLERVQFFFVGDEALREELEPVRRQSAEFISKVNGEDIRIVESVQRGRHSPAFVGGQFASAQEATSLQFQKILAAKVLAGTTRRPEDVATLETKDILHPAGG